MKKVALVFVLAVIAPSLALAWLAVRSLRDQQFLLERQQSLLYQGVADNAAKEALETLAGCQRQFEARVAEFLASHRHTEEAGAFDKWLRSNWPLAQVGFVVTPGGKILAPAASPAPARPEPRPPISQTDSATPPAQPQPALPPLRTAPAPLPNPSEQPETRRSIEPAQVLSQPQPAAQPASDFSDTRWRKAIAPEPQAAADNSPGRQKAARKSSSPADRYDTHDADARSFLAANSLFLANRESAQVYVNPSQYTAKDAPEPVSPTQSTLKQSGQKIDGPAAPANAKAPQMRNVIPQQQTVPGLKESTALETAQPSSRLEASETEFRRLIGDAPEGALARFVDDKLNILLWQRPAQSRDLIFGAQIALDRLKEQLRPLTEHIDPALAAEICVALLDDTAKPVALSQRGFKANWKRPFVATEIGEALPHWEAAVYLLDPAKPARTAQSVRLTLGLLIAVLVLAIGIGSWLIVADLSRQLTLARQKTDFVGNVSHELKTPLTAIRMFSELLAEGRVTDAQKQRSYLGIIAAEAARLTRLINNVLDFARLERGEKKYEFQPCDLAAAVRETAESYRPHLEANGFKLSLQLPEGALPVNADRDALAQVIVNLLSNAEKYSGTAREIGLRVEIQAGPPPGAEVKILDRGPGVPSGAEEKIFEKFYRAHDSLSSGIQGSGLGLTLARQIARAHGGEVAYDKREGGGSVFILRLPLRT